MPSPPSDSRIALHPGMTTRTHLLLMRASRPEDEAHQLEITILRRASLDLGCMRLSGEDDRAWDHEWAAPLTWCGRRVVWGLPELSKPPLIDDRIPMR